MRHERNRFGKRILDGAPRIRGRKPPALRAARLAIATPRPVSRDSPTVIP
jgi:hypothetical protein